MIYTLETRIRFSTVLGTWMEEECMTMEALGFTKEDLESKSVEAIESDLQGMFEDWEANHLDSGWSVVAD